MKKYFLFLTFLILFISGCSTLRPGSGGDGLRTPAVGNPNGIQISFNTLPQIISENFPPNVQVDVTNNAACNVNGKLWLNDVIAISQGGIEKPIFKDLNDNDKPLLGAVSEGGKIKIDKKSFDFNEDNGVKGYRVLEGFTQFDVDFTATAVYKCNINAGPKLCIKSSSRDDKDCKQTETITGSSNLRSTIAPITITRVVKTYSPSSSGVKLDLSITFSKMSKGRVTNTLALNDPFTAQALKEQDPVQVDVHLGTYPMECGDGDRYFKDGNLNWKPEDTEKTITCSTTITNDFGERLEDYLNVNLDFVYLISEKSSKITIRSSQV